jgi:hypothetical protein
VCAKGTSTAAWTEGRPPNYPPDKTGLEARARLDFNCTVTLPPPGLHLSLPAGPEPSFRIWICLESHPLNNVRRLHASGFQRRLALCLRKEHLES